MPNEKEKKHCIASWVAILDMKIHKSGKSDKSRIVLTSWDLPTRKKSKISVRYVGFPTSSEKTTAALLVFFPEYIIE